MQANLIREVQFIAITSSKFRLDEETRYVDVVILSNHKSFSDES